MEDWSRERNSLIEHSKISRQCRIELRNHCSIIRRKQLYKEQVANLWFLITLGIFLWATFSELYIIAICSSVPVHMPLITRYTKTTKLKKEAQEIIDRYWLRWSNSKYYNGTPLDLDGVDLIFTEND